MSPSTALRFSPDLSHSHDTLHKAASHLDSLHYVCNLVSFFYDVFIHEVNRLLALTTAVEQEYTFLSLFFPRYSVRIRQNLNKYEWNIKFTSTRTSAQVLNSSSFVKVLYIMSWPNLTERVTLQQESITGSSLVILRRTYIKDWYFYVNIYLWNGIRNCHSCLILYITFELLVTLATMGAWFKYKHINNNWVVN